MREGKQGLGGKKMQGIYRLLRPDNLENAQKLKYGCQDMVNQFAVEHHHDHQANNEMCEQNNGSPLDPAAIELRLIVKRKHRHSRGNN